MKMKARGSVSGREPIKVFLGPNPTLAEDGTIDDPLSDGEFVDTYDVDGMIDLYEKLSAVDRQIYSAKLRIREVLAQMTKDDGQTAKTRRIQGQRRKAKITMPDDKWEQKILRDAFSEYPELAAVVLSIASIRVKKREYDKLTRTTCEGATEEFRDMLMAANQGQQETPTLTVEE